MRRTMMATMAAGAALLAACSGEGAGNNAADAVADNVTAGTTMATTESANMAGAAEGATATATLATANGQPAGRATATQTAQGIRVSLEGAGLPPGQHGAHVHTVGRCDGPAFESAGPHWNPTDTEHGSENPAGPHGGDMPNLQVAADGSGTLSFDLPAGSFDQLLDADGAAMMIHADADDLRTDPSGNSGGRIACGVFQRG